MNGLVKYKPLREAQGNVLNREKILGDLLVTFDVLSELIRPRKEMGGNSIIPFTASHRESLKIIMELVIYVKLAKVVNWDYYTSEILKLEIKNGESTRNNVKLLG